MMAYINTDVLACLKKQLCELECKPDKISRIKARFLRRIISQIEGYKTADVEEVKYSKWLDSPCITNYHDTDIPVVECENCGICFCDIINNHRYMYRYCPHCGAKMDGGEKNERSVMDIDM